MGTTRFSQSLYKKTINATGLGRSYCLNKW